MFDWQWYVPGQPKVQTAEEGWPMKGFERKAHLDGVMRGSALLLCVTMTVGCATAPLARQPLPRVGTPVAASFSQTWDSAVQVLVEEKARFQTIERPNGLIVLEPDLITADADMVADCGGASKATQGAGRIVVRGNSTKSSVTVTFRFLRIDGKRVVGECATRGAAESVLESLIRVKAEAGSRP
jgi:hypothetical protein